MTPEVKKRIEMINRGDVPEGYKRYSNRNLIIPAPWAKQTIGRLCDFSGGSQPPLKYFIHEEKEGYIRLIQIRDYKTNDYKTYIPIEMAKKFCEPSDIMIGRYGPPVFQILCGLRGAYNVALIKAIPNEKVIRKEYMRCILKQPTLFKLIDSLSRRSAGQSGVDIDALNDFPLPLPSIQEQDKIISIIQTCDKVIELKEKLLEVKQQQKKWLMQNLLTGKKRLSGFTGEWKKVKLGDFIVEFTEKTIVNNQYPFLTSARTGLVFQSDHFGDAQLTTKDNVGYNIIPFGYITFRSRSDDGKFKFNINTLIEKGVVSYFYPVFTFNNNVNKTYLLKYMNNYLQKDIIKEITGTSQLVLSLKKLKSFNLIIPPLEEQIAIANILSTADKEIELMQQDLDQWKQKKKSLMQLLLMGIVRVN